MKPTKDELLRVRERLEQHDTPAQWEPTKREYLKYLALAAKHPEEYDEKELHNLILGAELVLEQH